MLGPDDEHTTAIVIKLNSGEGTVRIMHGERDVGIYRTSPHAQKEVVMVFLGPGLYCYLMSNAEARYIKRFKSA